jgi:cystathionine beta-lyase/cystathionine gamma-synthase
MTDSNAHGFSTRLIHAGDAPDPTTGALAPVLVRSKTFRQPTFGKQPKYQYSRGQNPTRSILEDKLVALLGEGQATVFGSGDAATAMWLLTLRPGDHIICCDELYGGTVRLLDDLFADFGISVSYVNVNNGDEVRNARCQATKALFVESPTNPKLGVVDLTHAGAIAKELHLPLIADMTFAPPCATNPFDYGATTVIYSLSKYIAGHNDVIGGAVITKDPEVHDKLFWLQRAVGAVLSPDECYRVIQEIKTLKLRWEQVGATAATVADYLQSEPLVERIYYPGLPEHPGHGVAKHQMKGGFGGVLSFDLATSRHSDLATFVEACQRDGVIAYAESLASPETILANPAAMSHSSLTAEKKAALGLNDNFFRLSVGLEDAQDIIAALRVGFGAVTGHSDVDLTKTAAMTTRAPQVSAL